jgi:tRNA U34 5-methylaminomethyl-2-thiouridine-forming methyltransferase MnmC
MNKKIEIIKTDDGSHSLYIPEMDEHYHSTFGAVQEAEFVYIDRGLVPVFERKTEVSVFEVGFGTGLNSFMSFLKAKDHSVSIRYDAVEFYPLQEEQYKVLNYGEILNEGLNKTEFRIMHTSDWNVKSRISADFELCKIHSDFHKIELEIDTYDVIYYDAFGPDKQDDMWSVELFRKCFLAMKEGGNMVTYSAKGAVRRAMIEAGFEVEKLDGPPGKRQMLRAWKPVSA